MTNNVAYHELRSRRERAPSKELLRDRAATGGMTEYQHFVVIRHGESETNATYLCDVWTIGGRCRRRRPQAVPFRCCD